MLIPPAITRGGPEEAGYPSFLHFLHQAQPTLAAARRGAGSAQPHMPPPCRRASPRRAPIPLACPLRARAAPSHAFSRPSRAPARLQRSIPLAAATSGTASSTWPTPRTTPPSSGPSSRPPAWRAPWMVSAAARSEAEGSQEGVAGAKGRRACRVPAYRPDAPTTSQHVPATPQPCSRTPGPWPDGPPAPPAPPLPPAESNFTATVFLPTDEYLSAAADSIDTDDVVSCGFKLPLADTRPRPPALTCTHPHHRTHRAPRLPPSLPPLPPVLTSPPPLLPESPPGQAARPPPAPLLPLRRSCSPRCSSTTSCPALPTPSTS